MSGHRITETPNILFLGAGASVPYEKLLMGDFVRMFRENRLEKNSNFGSILAPKSAILEAMCNEKEDLEFLIEELESIVSKGYLRYATGYPPAALSASQVVEVSRSKWPEFAEIARDATTVLNELKRKVYLHYRDIPDPARTEVLFKLIEITRKAEYSPLVFTTNYDPAIEELCKLRSFRLIDGFNFDVRTQENTWDRTNFERPSAYPAETSLVLFKLHGSTNWFKHRDRIIKAAPVHDPTDDQYANLMIYPAQRKVATSDPYFTAYDYLEQCLDHAKGCLVIGYSFRDYDTLMRFKSASLSNRDLKIVVLDPNANQICKMLKDYDIANTHPIPHGLHSLNEMKYLPLVQDAFSQIQL